MPNLISTISFGLCLNYTGPSRLRYLFQVVQTQTTTAYCRILPTLDPYVVDTVIYVYIDRLKFCNIHM
jgi:hypothetical protein